MKTVIVTWQAGGVTQPAIGLGRMLVDRGHDVRILAPGALSDRVAASGARLRAWPGDLDFDPSRGRSFEDQWAGVVEEVLMGPGLSSAIRAELDAETADVVVVDFMLRSTLFEVERHGLPAVPLMHMVHRFHGARDDTDPDAEGGWRWTYRQLNLVREGMRLDPLPFGPANPSAAIAARSAVALVVMPREFDDWPDPPANVIHVGPIFEEADGAAWDSPWTSDDPRPLIVVSLGTTYMYQEAVLARIAAALSGLDARVLVLTGSALDPEEVPIVADGVAIRRYVPHGAVLPETALLVTHGGMGTLMAAFAAGVPTLCIPLGRDQWMNAERAVELGTSRTISVDAEPGEIANAARMALDSASMRQAAHRMLAVVARYGEGRLAVEALENVVANDASRLDRGASMVA